MVCVCISGWFGVDVLVYFVCVFVECDWDGVGCVVCM